MKSLSTVQLQLLECLADGECHSGSFLGECLGISRTAIWKQISALEKMGLKIHRIAQQGYQLTQPFIPLDKQRIQQHLALTSFNTPIDYHVVSHIDSTNRFLKDIASSSNYALCCAETQTQGRGRFGRTWISPFGENIYLSIRRECHCCLSKLSGLSLVISLALLASLQKRLNHQDIQIKWPNDLIWNDKKLGGSLIEIVAETNGCAHIIIGIGLNVNTHTKDMPLTDKPWCSLYELSGRYFDRNSLIAEIIASVDEYIEPFLQHGFGHFQTLWQQADYLRHKNVEVNQFHASINGIVTGVTDAGELCLVDRQGIEHYLSSGDASLSKIGQTQSAQL